MRPVQVLLHHHKAKVSPRPPARRGHFQVSLSNPWGCTPCFCYGHTDQCASELRYPARDMAVASTSSACRMVASTVLSDFSRGPQDWVAEEAGLPTTSR